MAKNLVFGYLDHSKRRFSDFGMIQHGRYHGQLMHTIWFYQHMQYRVDPMHQTQDIGLKLIGSFKNAKSRLLNDPDFSRKNRRVRFLFL